MLIFMTCGILSIIALSIFGIYIWPKKEALEYTWFNDIKCPPNDYCPYVIRDELWTSKKDINPESNKYDANISKLCLDLISRLSNYKLKNILDRNLNKNIKLIGTFSNNPNDPTFGALWSEKDENNSVTVWLAFRGTSEKSAKEISDDLNYEQLSYTKISNNNPGVQNSLKVDNNVKIHGGFLDVYNQFRISLLDQLKKLKPNLIIISGHSLGSGVATICSLDLSNQFTVPILNYVFASPRVGNKEFCDLITNQKKLQMYRIINTCDIIPTLPLSVCPNFSNHKQPYFYQHCGIVISFTDNWFSLANNHELPIYINNI